MENPTPFKKAHTAVLSSMLPGSNRSRHEIEPGLHVIYESGLGEHPSRVAYEFDASTWPPDRALEWILTRGHMGMLRFIRAE